MPLLWNARGMMIASTLCGLAAMVVCAAGYASSASPGAGPEGMPPTTPAVAESSKSTHAPTAREAAAATYFGLFDSGAITLADGHWQGKPFVAGGSSAPRAGLVEHFLLRGDLDDDGMDEAVVLLWTSSGGSGTFDYLAVLDREADGSVVNRSTISLGDRVKLREGTVPDGLIVVDLVQAGPDDAACCPGQKVRWTLALEGETLTRLKTEDQGRLSLADLAGEWILTSFDRDEPVASNIEITLAFDGANIGGRSACNRYSGRVAGGDTPGELSTAGPLAATRMACQEHLMEAEREYLHRLDNLRGFSFVGGKLALTWSDGAESGRLLFDRRSGAGPRD